MFVMDGSRFAPNKETAKSSGVSVETTRCCRSCRETVVATECGRLYFSNQRSWQTIHYVDGGLECANGAMRPGLPQCSMHSGLRKSRGDGAADNGATDSQLLAISVGRREAGSTLRKADRRRLAGRRCTCSWQNKKIRKLSHRKPRLHPKWDKNAKAEAFNAPKEDGARREDSNLHALRHTDLNRAHVYQFRHLGLVRAHVNGQAMGVNALQSTSPKACPRPWRRVRSNFGTTTYEIKDLKRAA